MDTSILTARFYLLPLYLIIFFLTFTKISSFEKICPNGCICSTITDYSISCSTPEINYFLANIKPQEYVKIECELQTGLPGEETTTAQPHLNAIYKNLLFLTGLKVGPVKSINFRSCLLPNMTLAKWIEPMGVNVSKELQFSSYQNLTETFKKSHLSGFEHVEKLDLSLNEIKNLPNDLLEGFKNLKWLDLSGNYFQKLPQNFFTFVPKLQHLILQETRLTNPEDGHFANLTELKILDLRNNDIKLIPENFFSNLTNLEEFYMYLDNEVETLSKNVFKNLTKLRKLEIGLNNLATSPVASKLEIFKFSRNQNLVLTPDWGPLTEVLDDKDFDITPNDNKLKNLPDDFLHGFDNLKELDLSGNNIYNLQANFFKYVPKVEKLSLRKNHLTNLPDGIFANLNKVKILELQNNEISDLSENIFSKVINLEELDITSNNLQTLPAKLFKNCKNFRKIDMSRNNFSAIPKALFLAANLEKIKLDFNKQILTIPDYFFSNFNNLKYIRFENNSIRSIPENVFRNSSSLISIDISNNRLKSLGQDLFRDQTRLEELDLGFNEIEQIPENTFRNLFGLRILYLNDNRLQKISSNDFQGLKELKELELSNNQLVHLDGEAFKSFQRLVHLDLSKNQLSFKENFGSSFLNNTAMIENESPFRYCNNLEVLKVSNNLIDRVFKTWRQLPQLRHLDISNNKIQTLTVDDINFINDEVSVYFMHNNISVFDFAGVEALAKSSHSSSNSKKRKINVFVARNPINCDCRSYDFVRYLDEKSWPSEIDFAPTFDLKEEQLENFFTMFKDVLGFTPKLLYTGLKCEQPEALNGVLVKNVNLKDLNCPLEKENQKAI